jgi:uncharacterized membrane protein
MTTGVRFVLIALAAAILTHFAAIVAAPYWLMNAAMDRISEQGAKLHTWKHSPRTSERSRSVVRPAPDLAYSACVYDLKDGPVHVRVAPSDNYMSVSAFQHNSDNFFVVNDRQAPNGVDLILVRRGDPHPAGPSQIVESPSRRGIILQRRIAPTQERFDAIHAARINDVCASLSRN